VVSHQRFQFERFEPPEGCRIFTPRDDLLIPYRVFVFAFMKVGGGDESRAYMDIAADRYVIVHGSKYQAFHVCLQG